MTTAPHPAPRPRPALQGVLFDLDGTLLDTHDLILASFRHATRAVLGVQIPDEKLMARVGVPLLDQMGDFTDDPAMQQELVDVYREHNARVHDELVRIFPGVQASVETLREKGLALGVVTSKRSDIARNGLRVFGLEDAFAFVIGSDSCARHKPDPDPVLLGCERLGLDPSVCAYVGDSPFDLQASRAAGTYTVAATWGMFPEAVLLAEHPDAVCRAPKELVGLM